MLTRLRHHAIIGSYEQQCKVDAAGTRKHRVHQSLVAWNVDKTDSFGELGNIQEGIAPLDADTALPFLGQTVGIDASERAHQRRLAVVNVACGADDHPALRPYALRSSG